MDRIKAAIGKMPRKAIIIWVLILIGFGAMEFPGVLFFGHRAYPFVFGLPFIYAYMIACWVYMCIVMFYAYKSNWGRAPKEGEEDINPESDCD